MINMKLEPLKNKKHNLKKELNKKNSHFSDGFKNGVDKSFEVFSSYIHYYNRYQDNIKLLLDEQKKIWKEWTKYYDKQDNINKENYLEIYNKWLFNYIFIKNNLDNEEYSLF